MKSLIALLGKKIKIFLFLSLPLGIFVGVIEIFLAISLNDLLIFTNLIDGERKINVSNTFLIIFIVAILRFIFVYISQINTNYLYELVNNNIRELTIKKNYLEGREIGILKSQETLNIISSRVSELLNSISEASIQIFIFIIIYTHLLFQSFELTIYCTLIFSIITIPLLLIKKKIPQYSAEYQDSVRKVFNKIFKDLRNLNFLRIIGSLSKEKNEILKTNQKSLFPYLKYLHRLTFINQIPNFLGIILISLIIISNNKFNIMEKVHLIPFLYLMLRSIISFSHFMSSLSRFTFTYPFAEKLLNIMIINKKTEKIINNLDIGLNKKKVKNFSLVTSNLKYGFNISLNKPISLKVKKGSFCLLSGQSGIGKTTLIMTLVGLQKMISGKILWDGIEIQNIEVPTFRRKISYCGSDPFLIEGTVKENLIYGLKNKINDKNIKKALDLAKCDFLLRNKKYNTKYRLDSEGSGLSSGQKQRLAIARAILANPKLIIFDEATANIDEKTECQIMLEIKKNMKDCTIFAISHRQTLKKFADQLIEIG